MNPYTQFLILEFLGDKQVCFLGQVDEGKFKLMCLTMVGLRRLNDSTFLEVGENGLISLEDIMLSLRGWSFEVKNLTEEMIEAFHV